MLKPEIQAQVEIARRFHQKRKRKSKKPPVWLHPIGIEREYTRILVRKVKLFAAEINRLLLPILPSLMQQASLLQPDAKADQQINWVEELEKTLAKASENLERPGAGFNPEELEILATEIGGQTNLFNARQWDKTTRAVLGVELFQSEPWLHNELRSFARANRDLILSIKNQGIERISTMTSHGLRTGKRHEYFAKQLRSIYSISKNRAKLIARDQVSKLNGNLTRLRQTGTGIEKYIWRTSGDRRVRSTHRSFEGNTYTWQTGSPEGHPGEPVQCRCYAEAVFPEELLET